ncbi:MAG: hypothetical protein EAZ57_11110 [Cytophagales bacterium]|nr:MAG: hypothetical protein EAZ67_11770 [Cytophagales bacterium]TAF59425.1 MAG: hypothetical protein EAZ57_11110 [Cytophagales bacterium]
MLKLLMQRLSKGLYSVTKHYFFFSCLWLCTHALYAQVSPCFEADFTRGCTPFTVNMTDCSGVDNDLIFYDFGDGPKPKSWFIYTEPGRYTVTQVINSGAGGAQLTKENYIEVFAPELVIFEAKACSDGSVVVKINDTRYDSYFITFGDGTSRTVLDSGSVVHRYSSGTKASITVTGFFNSAANNCGSKTVEVDLVKNFLPPIFSSLRTLDPTRAEVSYKLPDNGNYGVFSDGLSIAPIANRSTETLIDGLDNPNAPALLFLANKNSCSDSLLQTQALRMLWLKVLVLDGNTRLEWNKAAESPDFQGYKLYKNNVLFKEFVDINELSHTDSDLICNKLYEYRLEAVYADSRRSISQNVKIKAASLKRPPTPDSVLVSVENQKVKIIFYVPDSVVLSQTLASANCTGAPFSASSKDKERVIYHHGNAFQNICCYTLQSVDECGNVSLPTAEYCPVVLKGSLEGNNISLNRSDYIGFAGTVYFLELLDKEGNVLSQELWTERSLNTTVKEQKQQVLRYRVRGEEYPTRQRSTFSNVVELVIPFKIDIPNAFTPNNDGLNDSFAPICNYLGSFEMEIFTKWGNSVFKTKDINSRWDGTLKGTPLNTDSYVYVIQLTDERGVAFQKRGEVMLIR